MTKKEFAAAVAIAQSNDELNDVDIHDNNAVFDGFGLPEFNVVFVTLKQVAKLIRWQAQYLTGGFDQEAMQEVAKAGRHKFMIVNENGTFA